MNRLLNKANKRIGVSSAAALLIGVSLIGQLLGFMRYKMVNANFSAVGPDSTDAYFAAFKIPDFFYFTLAAGALGVAFMPFLADRLQKGDKKGIWELSTSLLNLLTIVMFFVGIFILIFAEPLVHYVVAPNLPPEQLHNAVMIMRLIAFNPLLFAASGVLTSTQQTLGRFFFFAIAPLFYNVSIMISAIVFSTTSHNGGPGNLGLVGLGVGALVGAILHFAVVLIGLIDTDFHWRPKILWRSRDFKKILHQLPARSIDQGVDSINSIVETNLAARIGVGNISFYENAYILHTTPVLIIGSTIATAAFPSMTARLAEGKKDEFRREFLQIVRAMVWTIMPITVIAYFTRGYLSRLIFAKGSQEIATVFGFFTAAIIFRTLYAILSRWFYAQKDTRTPLFVSLFTIALNVILAYSLSRPSQYGVAGLAMAQSIVAAVEVTILVAIMLRRDHKLFNAEFWGGIFRILSVTGFTFLVTIFMIGYLPLGRLDRGIVTLGSKLGIITFVVLSVHLAVSSLFGLEEAASVIKRIKRIVLKPIKI